MVSARQQDPVMDIRHTIAENLTAWMERAPGLDTLKKVAARSGVSFGTVQRVKKAEVNLTVDNLKAIAAAFGRDPADLLRTTTDSNNASQYEQHSARAADHIAAEPVVKYTTVWPFPNANRAAYEALPPEGKAWVQGRLDAAIDQARQQFGSQDEKRSA